MKRVLCAVFRYPLNVSGLTPLLNRPPAQLLLSTKHGILANVFFLRFTLAITNFFQILSLSADGLLSLLQHHHDVHWRTGGCWTYVVHVLTTTVAEFSLAEYFVHSKFCFFVSREAKRYRYLSSPSCVVALFFVFNHNFACIKEL